MIVSTTDPITGRDIKDPENHPYIIEGEGEMAVKIYFESEETKRQYLELEVENPAKHFEHSLDNPASMGPGDTRHV